MDSEQKTIPFDALVSDHSLCDAWKAVYVDHYRLGGNVNDRRF